MSREIENLLSDVGFSMQEAAIYIALLKYPHSTGYKIAKEIGKSFSNTYKGLDSLNKKGAVIVDESQRPQKFTAVPISDYFDNLERKLISTRKLVEEKLEDIKGDTSTEGIYIIESTDQVFTRAINMVNSAKTLIVLDSYKLPLDKVRDSLEAAIERGVRVYIHTYCEYELAGAQINWYPSIGRLKPFPWSWLNLVVDTKEILISYMSSDIEHLHQAFWSRNPYLGAYVHNGTMHEFMIENLRNLLYQKKSSEELLTELHRMEKEYYGDRNWLNQFYGLFITPEDKISQKPEIIELPEIIVCGFENEKNSNQEAVQELWEKIFTQKDNIENVVNVDRFYLVRHNLLEIKNQRSYTSLVGKQIDSYDNIPDDMSVVTIPAQKYAKFIHRGFFFNHLTYAFINGTWFPSTNYQHKKTIEFEIYDKNFKPNDKESEMYIYIPIEEKGSHDSDE